MENLGAFLLSGTAFPGQDSLESSLWITVGSLESNASLIGVLSAIRANASGALGSSSEVNPVLSTLADLGENDDLNVFCQLATLNSIAPSATGTLVPHFQGDLMGESVVQAALLETEVAATVRGNDSLTGNAKDATFVSSLAAAQDILINFQPDASAEPAGYTKDIGEAYDDARRFGWVRQDSLSNSTHTPLNIVPNARDRQVKVDPRLRTLLHMQYPAPIFNETAVKTPAAWEYALPNGNYSVTVSVGDYAYFDSQHTINVEGVKAIDRFQGRVTQAHEQATVQVDVSDGRLTIDAKGGTNTKINYVEIEPVQETLTIPVLEDESVYLRQNDSDFNLDGSSYRGGLFTGVDGAVTASPARFYLKFDLPTFEPGTKVTAATLTGYYNTDYDPADDGTHGIYFVASDSWSESNITWDNQPSQAYGLSEATFNATDETVGSFVSWDLTHIVNQEYQGDGLLSLLFHAHAEGLVSENRNWEYFAEKEFDPTKAFRLELTTQSVP